MLFVTLDEPFDETENEAATMEFDKDYLKAKELESVKAARYGRVREFFLSRGSVSATKGRKGLMGTVKQ